MLVEILDERVDIGKGHLMAAVCDAGDRFERRGGIVDGQVQPLVLEITPVLGEKEQRFRSFQAPVEREFDDGLRSGGPSSDERERCRERNLRILLLALQAGRDQGAGADRRVGPISQL
jgi:hypothetical protein